MTTSTSSFEPAGHGTASGLRGLRTDQPALMHALDRLRDAALDSGTLPGKTKALIAVALAVAARDAQG